MTDKKFIKLIKETIVDYFNSHVDKTDHKTITEDDVYIVWSCKTVSDGMYYEITHNGDKNETYFDVYKKWENFVVRGGKYEDNN